MDHPYWDMEGIASTQSSPVVPCGFFVHTVMQDNFSALDVESLIFNLVVMKTTLAIFNDEKNFTAILFIINNPLLVSPTFGHEMQFWHIT